MSKALQKKGKKSKHKISTLVMSKALQKRDNKKQNKTLVMSKVPPARSFYYLLLVSLRLPPCLSPCKAAK